MLDVDKYLEDQTKMKLAAERKKNAEKRDRCRSRAEHEPSSDDDYVPARAGLSKNDVKLERITDDGDASAYRTRIKQWKANKKKTNSASLDDEPHHELNGGLRVPLSVWNNLYRYQKTGVKWLWELHRIETGGLLGDEMGLGKTVQLIAFLAALDCSKLGAWHGLGPSLVVAPATVIHQWVSHFHEWWPPFRVVLLHQSGSHTGDVERLVKDAHDSHGIVITSYAGIVRHRAVLGFRRWHYIVLDEGHKIKNSDTQMSKAVRTFDTPHRIVITGSPLQNNLQELWGLFDFMSPGLLGTLQAFTEHFAAPITQGGYANATRFQEMSALSLAVALKDTISPYMLRRTKSDVRDHLKLPDKNEQVLFCSLSDEQKDLYKNFLSGETVKSIINKESRFGDPIRARILVALLTLRKICNHPDLYIYELEEEIPDTEEENHPAVRAFGFWKRAGKMIVIHSLLKIWKRQGHRALIFTQSRAMLCVLEQFLQQCDYKYLKMDGGTNIASRQPLIATFNMDSSYLVFLATTRVGGLGINMTGADRVIIYDPDWNPTVDCQAKERAWRIGQNRNVTVYRLLSAGTVEEKIYQRQVFKQFLSNKVLVDAHQKNYLQTSTLQGLFALEEPDKSGSTETVNIFKHSKVSSTKKDSTDYSILLSGSVSFSNDKMVAMRKLAQKISKSMSTSASDKTIENSTEVEDPRERYKRKLQSLASPPPVVEIPINTVDDHETDADFSTVLSEIDIVHKYANPKVLEKLECIDTENDLCKTVEKNSHDLHTDKPEPSLNVAEASLCSVVAASESSDTIPEAKEEKFIDTADTKRKNRKRKSRKRFEFDNEKIRCLESVTNVKQKHKKKTSNIDDDHDKYVLEKLFAKSGVQNALQHDKVVGLAEREETHRMRTEAQEKALNALKVLKKSRIKNWRW